MATSTCRDCEVTSALTSSLCLKRATSFGKLARYLYMAFMGLLISLVGNLFGNHRRSRRRGGWVIPLDIEMEIMSYMPARDVLICKSVCKAWRDMLSTQSFANLHMRRAELVNVLSLYFRDKTGIRLVSEDDLLKQKSPTVYPGFIKLPSYFRNPCRADWVACYDLITSCNGLFVMRKKNGNCCIVNPALQEQVCLPRTSKYWHRMQLYYVPSSNQYKLIAVISTDNHPYFRFGVLTVGEKKWRYLRRCRATEFSLSLDAPHLFRACSNHFDNDRGKYAYSFDTKDKVLTFDLESERLIEHELPEEMKHFEKDALIEFSERWGGYTAIICYQQDIAKVFILEDYTTNRWVKKEVGLPVKLIEDGRRMKKVTGTRSYNMGTRPFNILADEDGGVCFHSQPRKFWAFHSGTQKAAYNELGELGNLYRVCPSKFSLVSCKGMSSTPIT